MKIGVLGTGLITKRITPLLAQLEETECYAIASRTRARAEQAAAELGYAKAYGSYEELVSDPQVELVYIATPHSRHYEDMKLCISHKKPVLCEKAFVLNAEQAKEIQALAAEAGVYVAEAIWPAYQPSRRIIKDLLDSGIIGSVSTLTANLSFVSTQRERMMSPELAGGALLDLGIYGLHFAAMFFGTDIERIDSTVQFTDTGVDGMESITLTYRDGRMAVLTHSLYARSDHQGVFYGDKGCMVVENMINPRSVTVYDDWGNFVSSAEIPPQINGYEYEFLESIRRIQNGEIESSSMPLAHTVRVMELADTIRQQWNYKFPQEQN